jgi:hypothetical protein
MVLTFDKSFVVSKQMFQLLDASDICKLIFSLINFCIRARKTSSIFSLIKYLETAYLLINRSHKLLQTLEIHFKLLNHFFSTFIKVRIYQLIAYQLDLVA